MLSYFDELLAYNCVALTALSLSLPSLPQQELANFLNLICHLVDTEGKI